MKLCVNKEFTPSCFLQWSKKILQKNAPSTAHLYEQTLNLPTPVEDRNANFCKLLMHFYQKLSVSNIILCTATYASNWALWWNPTALCGVKGWVALKKPSIKHCSTSSCVVCCVCVCVRSLEDRIGIGSSMTRTLAGNKVEPVLTSVAAEVCVFVFFVFWEAWGSVRRDEPRDEPRALVWLGLVFLLESAAHCQFTQSSETRFVWALSCVRQNSSSVLIYNVTRQTRYIFLK